MSTLPDPPLPENPNRLATVKQCCKCKAEKALAEFSKHNQKKDGLHPWCNSCRAKVYKKKAAAVNEKRRREYHANVEEGRRKQREYREANREKDRRWSRKNYARNGKRWKAAHAAYRARNRDKIRAHQRKLYEANLAERKAYSRNRYVNNREQLLAQMKAWRKANPAKVLAANTKRRALVQSLPADFTNADIRFGLSFWGNACAVCGTPFGLVEKCHWDHWIPVSGKDCPGTAPCNMLPLCSFCNLSKHDCDGTSFLVGLLKVKAAKRKAAQIADYFSQVRS